MAPQHLQDYIAFSSVEPVDIHRFHLLSYVSELHLPSHITFCLSVMAGEAISRSRQRVSSSVARRYEDPALTCVRNKNRFIHNGIEQYPTTEFPQMFAKVTIKIFGKINNHVFYKQQFQDNVFYNLNEL